MSSRVCVIDIPGLSRELLNHVPGDCAFGKWLAGRPVADLKPSWPAVTCSVQATLTTGVSPSKHGIVANGLPTFLSTDDQALVDQSNFVEFRKQISFWEQSNQFVQAPRFWQNAEGQSRYKTALLFFQNSMPGFWGDKKPAADIVLTPKPDHGPDGKLVSLCWSNPPELVPELFKELGPFPLMNYWGPMAGIASSTWIAKAAAMIWIQNSPQLQLVYVPHLDYDLQRFGPQSTQASQAVIAVSRALDPLFEAVLAVDGKVAVISEYSISQVCKTVQPNLILKDGGFLKTRPTADGDLIDYDASQAIAMIDHQIAHVYAKSDKAKKAAEHVLNSIDGVVVLDQSRRISHSRAGDIQLEAAQGYWFDYRWWSRGDMPPTFARSVDIHRKPGYDPLELFLDPGTRNVSQNEKLIFGSHGRLNDANGIAIGSLIDHSCDVEDFGAVVLQLLNQ